MSNNKEDDGDRDETSYFGDVEGKKIMDESNGDVNELATKFEEEKKGEIENQL